MSVSTIEIWHCDANGCVTSAPAKTDGWTYAIYTHGCPDHGAVIEAHKATVDSETRGRGRSEKTTWFLKCACGYSAGFSTWNYSPLLERHLTHLKAQP